MSRGVPKDLATKAQEQLDKQQRLVDRLRVKVDVMDRELHELRTELAHEQDILSYYVKHPALGMDADVLPLEMKR